MNPYFVWEPHDGGPSWRPFPQLLSPDVAASRVAASRAALAGMFGLEVSALPERVVASVLLLGYASRLVSPPLARALDSGSIPAVTPEDLWWREVPGGPLPMAVSGSGSRPAGEFFDVVVLGLVEPLVSVFGERFRLSPHVLWGNVASALGGAAGQLSAGAWPIVAGLLERAPLRGMADVRGGRVQRRNCCLYYRVPGGGTCGDCVLNLR
ncbi:(2Fe-2S)-binding protein [Dactylosporangium sp. CA-052675]|uniref:(2Fe-2S)-binding protein n=1 Tax=Dactylosporangium sp. CA-052675 TaxID=3239927 RepID=UPI003D8CC2DF